MARQNYAFEKRQRELAKKKKKEEKKQQKALANAPDVDADEGTTSTTDPAASDSTSE